MLRNGASRLALRSIGAPASRSAAGFRNTAPTVQWATRFGSLATRRPRLAQVTALKPIQSTIIRHAVTDAQKKAESQYSKEEIKPTPEIVSATSSTRQMTGEVGVTEEPKENSAAMTSGLRHDVVHSYAQHITGTKQLKHTEHH